MCQVVRVIAINVAGPFRHYLLDTIQRQKGRSLVAALLVAVVVVGSGHGPGIDALSVRGSQRWH